MSAEATYVVRDARAGEHAAMADLVMGAYREYETLMEPAAWRGLERAIRTALASVEPVERIVAVDEGADEQTLIGAVLLYPARANAYGDAAEGLAWPEVRLLSVPPAARGRGVARALMGECVRRARAAGAAALGIHTSRSMHVARAMYVRMGFVRDPAHDFQPDGAELVEGYRLPLS